MSELSDGRVLKSRREGWCIRATISDPATRNAMTADLVNELEALLDATAADPSARALVIEGENGLFCAGADLKTVGSGQGATGRDRPVWQTNRRGGRLFKRLSEHPMAVIAIVDGPAFGGGFGLACCADIVISTERAKYALSETTLGLVPAQIAPHVVNRVGLRMARRLALTAARLDGVEAVRIGLADFVVKSNDEAMEVLAQVLSNIDRCAPVANARTKALLLAVPTMDGDAFADHAADVFAASLEGPEGQEGLAAFAAKRLPNWVGGQ